MSITGHIFNSNGTTGKWFQRKGAAITVRNWFWSNLLFLGNTLHFPESKRLIGISGIFIGVGEILGKSTNNLFSIFSSEEETLNLTKAFFCFYCRWWFVWHLWEAYNQKWPWFCGFSRIDSTFYRFFLNLNKPSRAVSKCGYTSYGALY